MLNKNYIKDMIASARQTANGKHNGGDNNGDDNNGNGDKHDKNNGNGDHGED
jgi:hypothetical protein